MFEKIIWDNLMYIYLRNRGYNMNYYKAKVDYLYISSHDNFFIIEYNNKAFKIIKKINLIGDCSFSILNYEKLNYLEQKQIQQLFEDLKPIFRNYKLNNLLTDE